MEQLIQLLPSLTGPQIEALTHVATAMLYAEPKRSAEYITVAQAAKEYRRPVSNVYAAMNRGDLAYTTPKGQTKPRYVRREEFEAWLGMR